MQKLRKKGLRSKCIYSTNNIIHLLITFYVMLLFGRANKTGTLNSLQIKKLAHLT